MLYPEKQTFCELAKSNDIVPIYKEILADADTPVTVLARFANNRNAFLLESMEGGEKWGRFSFLGVDPELLFEVDHSNGRTGELESKIKEIYSNLNVAQVDGLPRFFGGAVGFLTYEAITEFENMPKPKASEAACLKSRFLKADRIIIFDNVRHTIKIVVCKRISAADDPAKIYDEAKLELDGLAEEMRKPAPEQEFTSHAPADFKSNFTREDYEAVVRKTKDYIYDGDIIQAVLSQKFSAKCSIPPLQLYRALRYMNPSPYTFFLKIDNQTLVGSSPEVMVRLTGDRVELRPIAGTRKRGASEQEDVALAEELLADEKEKAEHVMLVDLGRNDVGRVSEPGSVEVTDYMVVERYSHVMHLVSHVQGILSKEHDAYDVIKATFPAGTLSGAPKIRAMEIIHALEPEARGVYGGAVGYISYSGNMDLAITIRTIEMTPDRVSIQAGAGIVYDSVPRTEFEETCHKAMGMRKAIEMAANGLDVAPKVKS